MQQLSIFDETVATAERKVGFINRWHLLDNGEMAATVIPGVNRVTIMGMFYGQLSRLNIVISYEDYERFIETTQLLEVRP